MLLGVAIPVGVSVAIPVAVGIAVVVSLEYSLPYLSPAIARWLTVTATLNGRNNAAAAAARTAQTPPAPLTAADTPHYSPSSLLSLYAKQTLQALFRPIYWASLFAGPAARAYAAVQGPAAYGPAVRTSGTLRKSVLLEAA